MANEPSENQNEAYLDEIATKIAGGFQLPEDLKDDTKAIICFSVNTSGEPIRVRLGRSSGIARFDGNCLRSIRDAAPFQQIPMDLHFECVFQTTLLALTIVQFDDNHSRVESFAARATYAQSPPAKQDLPKGAQPEDICSVCAEPLLPNYRVCPHCLRACQREHTVSCPDCAELITVDAASCWFCNFEFNAAGVPVRKVVEPPELETAAELTVELNEP